MRDKSKQLLVINTGKKKSEQTGMPSQSGTTHIIGGGGLSVNMSDYLLKSIWDKVFEIRTDSQGIEYIFGKLPMVTQYGITMYSGDGVDIPSLASGLPFDGRTIWYNPDTQQIEVIGGTGGGSGEGVSNFWDLSGIPSWITNSKPKYTYSEIEGTPDLSGFATQKWIISQGYASAKELKKYIPISGYTEVSGEKNFTGGLKVNGSPIYYDTEKKYWKLEGDLLVTGGVTMYGNEGTFTPSTIMDAILYDSATLGINSNGQLYVKGGNSGGGLDITALQNYLTQNSYLNVTSGDNRYLKLSGGTINVSSGNPYIGYANSGANLGRIGVTTSFEPFFYSSYTGANNTIWHSGNFTPSNYLPLTGGTLTGSYYSLTLKNTNQYASLIRFDNSSGELGYIGMSPDGEPWVYGKGIGNGRKIWTSANDGSGSTLDADLLDGKHLSDILASNVASATKLQTARTIWGQSFDGSGNVDGNIIVKGQYVGITLQGTNSYNTGITFNDYEGNPRWNLSYRGLNAADKDFYIYRFTDDNSYHVAMSLIRYNGNIGIGTPNPQQKIDVVGKAYVRDGILMSRSSDNSDAFFIGKEDTASQNLQILNSSGSGKIVFRTNRNSSIVDHFVLQQGSTALYDNLTINGYAKANYYDVSTTRQTSLSGSYTLGCGMYGSSIQHSVSDGYTLPALMWSAKSPNGNSSQFSIMSYHPSGETGYLIIGVAKNGTRTAFIEVQGDGVIQAGGDFLASGGITMYSDQRKKTILNHVELSLKQIAEAPLIEHYYNSDEKKTTHVGSIAQYWANMNDWFCKLDSEGYYTMEIQNAALASAISIARELERYETKTDKAIKKLKKRICELEEEVERLKAS